MSDSVNKGDTSDTMVISQASLLPSKPCNILCKSDLDVLHQVWTRPEDLLKVETRPVYSVSAAVGGSDLAGAVVGALAASAIAWQPTDPGQYATYMTVASQVYQFGKAFPGL